MTWLTRYVGFALSVVTTAWLLWFAVWAAQTSTPATQWFGRIRFRVYTPAAPLRWSLCQARIWLAPFIWAAWLLRGLRLRVGWTPRGRAVTVADMLAYHPGKPWRCLCRGEGTIASWRKGERGMQFCASMLSAFRAQAGFRVVQTKRGPRWVAGFEPEKLVQVEPDSVRGGT